MKSIFIGICGGSASGKTTFCNQLYEVYKDRAHLISQDEYYHDRSALSIDEIRKVNFDNPESVDLLQLYKDLSHIKSGNNVSIPRYCFRTHSRLSEKTFIAVREIILVEGLFVFETEELRNLFDYKIFVTADDDIRLIRRIKRDIEERGRDLKPVLDQYLTSVKPMYEMFIEPKNKYADYIINTSKKTDFHEVMKPVISKINSTWDESKCR